MDAAWLGRAVPATEGGFFKKAVCVAAAGTSRFAWTHLGGIKEFRNAVLLFIHFDGSGANALLDGGRAVTWRAQNKQTLFSAQLLRMLHHAKGAWYPPADADGATADDGGARTFLPPCAVGLAARVDESEPYVWLGQLEHVKHDPRSHPVEVVWRLKSFDALLAAKDGAGAPGARFRALVKAAGV